MLQAKNRKANEFRAKADAVRAELMDETKTFTKDEIEAKATEISGWERRAQIAAEFTPEAEIERQGGDELVKKAGPEADELEAPNYAKRVKELAERVDREFGGPNSLILALAKRHIEPLSSRQEKVIKAIKDLQSRATIVGTASDASGGEFLLPLQQVASIFSVDVSVGGITDTASRYAVSGRTLRIPYLKQTDATKTRPYAGIANVTIVGEAASKPEAEPSFAQRLLTVYKWAAYTEFGDEILADDLTGELAPTVQKAIGGQVMNVINEQCTIDGNGTAQPLGAFNASNPGIFVVPRKTANTFTVTDAFAMYARHVMGPRSRWYIHPSVLPQFMGLTLAGTTLVTWIQSLNAAPQMQLLGIPVVVTPLVALLGTQADVCLGNGDFYALAIRSALTVESSIHYKFQNDITAYRFFARAGGIPIPDGTYSYKSDGTTKTWEVSPFVVLDDAVAS